MNLLAATIPALLRGAAIAATFAGLADGWAMALGGGSAARALALGALLLACGWGACHLGSARPPARASFLWLLIVGSALPMLAAWAPWSGLLGAFLVLPVRVLGARLSSLLHAAERPALALGAMLAGALLGVAWAASAGLGFGGFVLVAATAGLLTAGAPDPPVEPPAASLPPWSLAWQRLTGIALGAGATWTFALLAPLLRAHDASDAGADARALLTLAGIVLFGWWTLGAFLAEHRFGDVLAALVAGAAALLLPFALDSWRGWSEPLAFDALLRAPLLRTLFDAGAPRLPERHPAYVPLLILVGAGLPVLLHAALLRGWHGARPSGPLRLAPLLLGGGFAMTALALPVFEQEAGFGVGAGAAMIALLLAALGVLICAEGPLPPRAGAAVILAVAALWAARIPAPPPLAFPMQDAREWTVSAAAQGAPLQARARGALWRVVGAPDGTGARPEHLARGRNLLTPPLDEAGPWTRELELALVLRPGARRLLLAGAPHPASLRAAARGGVQEAVFAGEAAALRLLAARDPRGYGLRLGGASAVALAPGEYDLILLRSLALWDEDLALLRAGIAAQAARRLAPGGFCLFALGPEQLAPGMLPSLLAAWREIFPRVTLFALPDGLRGVRLLIAAAAHREGAWPAELAPLQVGAAQIARIANQVSRAALAPPLPRVRAALAGTVWRLADGLGAVRRAAQTLDELAPAAQDGAAPPPSLLRAYALHYADQRYSAHDTFLAPGPEAIEVGRPVLEELARLARAHPDSAWLRALWSDAAGTLAAKREAGLIEEFARPLREELGWRDAGLTLALARAAAELLDEEEARALIAEVLEREPGHPAALALLDALEHGLAPDAHAGHGHD